MSGNTQLERKKEEERSYLEQFLELYEDMPKGKLSASESPDFIFSPTRKTSIGIELTKLIIKDQPSNKFLSRESIAEVIEKKNGKLALYRKKRINFYWLIIIIEDLLGDMQIHQHTDAWNFESPFHKIFLFYPAHDQVMEIL